MQFGHCMFIKLHSVLILFVFCLFRVVFLTDPVSDEHSIMVACLYINSKIAYSLLGYQTFKGAVSSRSC